MAYVVGLTGGIGSGKSAVADGFARHGIAIVDSDAIAHELTGPSGAAMSAIGDAFGASVIAPDGSLDRASMRARAFTDPAAKARLEAILHPMIAAESARLTHAAASPYVVQVVPLLVEGGMGRERFNRILVVDCDDATRVARVQARSHLSTEEIGRIMQSQATREARLARADDVIRNEGSLAELDMEVERLHRKYLVLAADLSAQSVAHQEPPRVKGLASAPVNGRESPHPFTAAAPVIVYEYPLSERVRTLLRLESLFARVAFYLAHTEPLDHHAGLLTIFEILEVSGRADLKSDLLQELERQKQILSTFKDNPDIAQDVLTKVLADIEQASQSLFAMTGKIGQYLRENEWLMGIKQRTGIPGGACEFDLPSYHFWLHREGSARLADLQGWVNPMLPIRDAGAIVLRLLREGGKPAPQIAHQGAFSQMLGGKVAQLVRIKLPMQAQCVPEISANKYALNVRFTSFAGEARPKLVESDVDFELTFCNL